MKEAYIVITGMIALIIAFLWPFYRILRGGHFRRTVLWSWAVLFLFFVADCFLIPGAVFSVSREMGGEMFKNWVPEGPAVVAAAFMGWMSALQAGLVALGVRWIMKRFFPHAFGRLDVA